MDVLIVASGKSSRLFNYTKNYIPKYLLNIDNYPALVTIINYWSKYAKRFFLIIDEKFNILTNFTINNFLKELQENIYILNYNNQDGTAYTIDYIYNNYLINYNIKNLLISWCDILPKENLNIDKLKGSEEKNNLFIFTYGNNCRYLLKNNKIMKNSNGNIIGIYYIENLNYNIKNIEKNIDIVEYFNNFKNIKNYKLNDLLDFGDEEKYKSIINLQNSCEKITCRSFNEINIKDNLLLKRALNDKGREVIKHEINFYKFLNSLNNKEIINLFPKINEFYESAFSMVYMHDYINLYKFLNKNNNLRNEMIIKNVIDKLDLLHNFKKIKIEKNQFLHDIKSEMYDKIINRIENIKDILNYFPNFKKVNNVYIDSFDTVINKIQKYLFNYYETLDIFEYHIIHGDTNFSNILINPDNEEIKFIDPRGYFSKSKIFGLIDYEYAKILYGISGYDNFNNHHFKVEFIDNKEIKFNIKQIDVSSNFINENFNKIHKILLVIIWLGLAEYNKNNIWKCIASYYHGLYLGTLLEL